MTPLEKAKAVLNTFTNTTCWLQDALDQHGMNSGDFWRLRKQYPLMEAQYKQAREMKADLSAQQVVKIADTEENPNKARNMIEARKWLSGKIDPKQYGDAVNLNVQGTVDLVAALAPHQRDRLRLISDSEQIDDAEVIDKPKQLASEPTDHQSVAGKSEAFVDPFEE